MTAKYATTCAVCASPVRPGEEIGKSGSGWAHGACAESAPPGAAPSGSAQPKPVAARPTRSAPRPDMPAVDGALEVWTDGACSGNPGPGGWAWATKDGRQDSGGEARTTNQRMEIRAALEAVRGLDGPLGGGSGSTYVVDCFPDGGGKGWVAPDWATSARKAGGGRRPWGT